MDGMGGCLGLEIEFLGDIMGKSGVGLRERILQTQVLPYRAWGLILRVTFDYGSLADEIEIDSLILII